MRRVARILVLLLTIQPRCHAQVGPDQNLSGKPIRPYTLSLSVNLVVLDVTVLNRKGESVPGLEKQHFRIYENGHPQTITLFHNEDTPITVGLVVDSSGSIRGKRSEIISAALAFAKASHPQDEVFTVHFNEDVALGLPANQLFTGRIDELTTALSRIVPQGQTALYDALYLALEHLKKGFHSKKAILLISDGGDNASRHTFEEILRMARKSNAAIYTIGIYDTGNRDQNPRLLRQLSKVSGGQSFFPASIQEVQTICNRTAKAIRSQYTIGYTPSDVAKDGRYRSIQVTAHVPSLGKLAVRTREGYYAPSHEHRSQDSLSEGAQDLR